MGRLGSKEVKLNVKRSQWFKIGKWKEPGFLQDIIIQAEIEKRKDVALPYTTTVYLFAGFKQYILQSEYDDILRKMQRDLREDPGQVLSRIRDEVKLAIAMTDKYSPSEINEKSLMRYIELVKIAAWQSLRFILLGYALEIVYPKSLPQKFTIGKEEFTPQKLLALVGLPKEIAPMVAERNRILEIASSYRKNKDIEKDLSDHAKQFGWMNSICWWDAPFSVEHYRNEVMDAAEGKPEKELQSIKKSRAEQYSKANKLLRVIKTKYPLAYSYIDMIREMADLRSHGWDAVSRAGVRMRPLFARLAAKNDLDYEQVMMLTTDEMISLINDKVAVTKKEIDNRLESLALYADSNLNEIHVFSGVSADEISRSAESKAENQSSLSGLTIWPGIITGKVIVMHSKDDIKKISKGEILICPMTDPDFMPAIYKASAMVTDQGGVLCHAAIIARELQKPCVVGTKIATQVIKTGDVIEVDATNGVVRILK